MSQLKNAHLDYVMLQSCHVDSDFDKGLSPLKLQTNISSICKIVYKNFMYNNKIFYFKQLT